MYTGLRNQLNKYLLLCGYAIIYYDLVVNSRKFIYALVGHLFLSGREIIIIIIIIIIIMIMIIIIMVK